MHSHRVGKRLRLCVTLLTEIPAAAATNPQLLECISSWLREIPVSDVVKSPLLEVIFNALNTEDSFDAAVDCLCTIFKETNDVEEYLPSIEILLPKVIAQKHRILAAAKDEDLEALKGITRLFSEAGEAWVILIAREATHFRPLVEAILECAARDQDRDAIGLTFNFWYELKQLLVVERFIEARMLYMDVYSKLVDILMKQLEFPTPEDPTSLDLFDGDREQEEKFREFRHYMGDCLKDCCEVMGVTECLTKVLDAMKLWMAKHGSQATATSVPHWQELEAPLFAMRAMGKMVDRDEDIILPQIMPILVQIPAHEKLRFATIMVLGRYTEWTSNHPESLAPQFQYIIKSFDTDSKEIIRAAAMAMKFFCTDCKHLLTNQVEELQSFYNQTLDVLPSVSQEELTEGVATVVAVQPPSQIFRLMSLYCDPLMGRIVEKARNAKDQDGQLAVAGKLCVVKFSGRTLIFLDAVQLLTIFIQWVIPRVDPGQPDPAVQYCEKIFPILSEIIDTFIKSAPICERICRCWRNMIISYRTAMEPLLPAMADKLASGFEASKQGCFLWVTAAILREFSEDREHVTPGTTDAIYKFFEAQSRTTLRIMSSLEAKELPDIIEDFFRLLTDALLYYSQKLIPSDLFTPILQAAISAMALEQREPLTACLHYIRDVIAFGTDNPPSSTGSPNPASNKQIVGQVLLTNGEELVNRVMAGMMITFPRDCFADGSGVLLELIELMPQQAVVWVAKTVSMLPEGTITPVESKRLIDGISARLSEGQNGVRNIRSLLQDFTNSYRRRYIAPRDGLGRLEATRFRFSG
jgi:transportin-3